MISALLCRSITGIVSSSDNSIFQDKALQVADSSLEDLPIKIQAGILPFLPDPAWCPENTNTNTVLHFQDYT